MKKNINLLIVTIVIGVTTIIYSRSSYISVGGQDLNSSKYVFIKDNDTPIPDIEETTIETVSTFLNDYEVDMQRLNQISDTKEWFLEYKEIIKKYDNELDPPETLYDYFSSNELEILFGVVQAEIGDEWSFEQKCNVASVIFNRINHERFGDEIASVLTENQFETIRNGAYRSVEVSEETVLACEYVFMIEDTTNGCLFFDSNNALDYPFSFNDGAHNFYKLDE